MNSIEFFFDGKLQKLDFDRISPTTTVLKYLRSLPGRQGTKEGCAEGDCGACTVVIASLENGKVRYRAVNSCLVFLPALHGKWLITVEDLGSPQQLHVIQQAFVDNFASQCGFCTPGFEMALYALSKETSNPTQEELNEAVEGNLCRCTGYRSIRDAAASLRSVKAKDTVSALEQKAFDALSAVKQDEPLVLRYKDQVYAVPFTVEQALELKEQYPDAVIVNGGTDVALRVSKQKQHIPVIIDLEHISGIKYIRETQDAYEIGAGTTVQDVKNFAREKMPHFYDLLKNFGAKQIRNRATLGGNISTASPIGDLIPPLMAMDAVLTLTGAQERNVKLEDFITGYRQTVLKQDEIITQITIPKKPDWQYRFYKISKRTKLDITTVSLAAGVKLADGKVEDIVLIYGGMAATVKHAGKAEQLLQGKTLTPELIDQAAAQAASEFTPISDARAGAQARSVLAKNLVIKFFNDINV